MERLDKLLASTGRWSRREVKVLVKEGRVLVDGVPAARAEDKADPAASRIQVDGEEAVIRAYTYVMLNKPAGVLSATEDPRQETVLDLLSPELRRQGLSPVGRLDKDSEGLLLLTNDGELAHRLLSPKRHVDKTYLVTLKRELSEEELLCLERGVDIGEERPTMPARVCRQGKQQILLTIHEGKFHQVKRMAQAVDNQVTALKRVSFGGLSLDESLHPGEYRPLSEEEVRQLRNVCEK